MAESNGPLAVTAVEVDSKLIETLERTLNACEPSGVSSNLVHGDFLAWAVEARRRGEKFDMAILNPPYRKINVDSPERRFVAAGGGPEVSNLYAAFVAATLPLIRPGGQLVAITPRSWANGPYFKRFRQYIFDHAALTHLHIYETRNTAFADAGVLQENIIFRLVREEGQGPVMLSKSLSPEHEPLVMPVPFARVVRPGDTANVIHLEVEGDSAEVARQMASLPSSLVDLQVSVSTGRVVDFRCKEALRANPDAGTVPLIYPTHLRRNRILWPQPGNKKPNALAVTPHTRRLLLPNEHYPVVKRFSSKEERRRVVACLSSADDLPGREVAFENHTNVYHHCNRGLDPLLATGLVVYLNSTLVDRYFRLFSGHTQVNATDLRSLRYPDLDCLKSLGDKAGGLDLDQGEIDELLASVLP